MRQGTFSSSVSCMVRDVVFAVTVLFNRGKNYFRFLGVRKMEERTSICVDQSKSSIGFLNRRQIEPFENSRDVDKQSWDNGNLLNGFVLKSSKCLQVLFDITLEVRDVALPRKKQMGLN